MFVIEMLCNFLAGISRLLVQFLKTGVIGIPVIILLMLFMCLFK